MSVADKVKSTRRKLIGVEKKKNKNKNHTEKTQKEREEGAVTRIVETLSGERVWCAGGGGEDYGRFRVR